MAFNLTDSQQAELASTGHVVVAVPCDPQPTIPVAFVGWCRWGEEWATFDVRDPEDDAAVVDEWTFLKPGDKIPTPAGDAIVRDVDVRLNEVWEWVVTL